MNKSKIRAKLIEKANQIAYDININGSLETIVQGYSVIGDCEDFGLDAELIELVKTISSFGLQKIELQEKLLKKEAIYHNVSETKDVLEHIKNRFSKFVEVKKKDSIDPGILKVYNKCVSVANVGRGTIDMVTIMEQCATKNTLLGLVGVKGLDAQKYIGRIDVTLNKCNELLHAEIVKKLEVVSNRDLDKDIRCKALSSCEYLYKSLTYIDNNNKNLLIYCNIIENARVDLMTKNAIERKKQ